MESGREFNVPEPQAAINRGFLTDYWRYDKPLPELKGWQAIGHSLHRGVQAILVLPLNSVISVVTIALSLFLLGGFLLLLINVGELIGRVGNTLSLSLYLKEGALQSSIEEFIREVRADSRVRSVNFVSKEDALRQFRADLGSRSGFLAGLAEDNPLPASLDIMLHPDQLASGDVDAFVNKLRSHDLVDEIVYGSEWVERMQAVLRMFRYVGLITFCIALSVVISLMASTIKLAVYSRREEIAIMKLVGASDRFIKIPFTVCGIIQGLIGSLVGLVLLKIAFIFLNYQLGRSMVFGLSLPSLAFLDLASIAVVVAVGVIVGALASLFALGRFMNV